MFSDITPNIYNICGIVITYNGEDTISQTLVKLNRNIKSIIIVDNNSRDDTLKIVRNLNMSNIYILQNITNIGIAAALNIGANYAKKLGFLWIITMDQDSFLEENAVNEMISVYSNYNDDEKKKIACLAPVPVLNERIKCKNEFKYVNKDYVITSGNLVNLNCLEYIGGYEEKLFIDSVDFDFCLKLRESNLLIIQCTNAIMQHNLGKMKEITCFGFSFKVHEHSSLRKYYISRNHIYILKRFFKSNSKFCIKKTLSFVLFLAQILFLESDKKSNFEAVFRGLKHGIEGKYD